MATGTILLPPHCWIPDAAAPPGLRYEDGRPEWLFDAAADEIVYATFRMPENYASGGALKVQFKMASATSGSVCWAAAIEAISPGDAADADTASFDTACVDSEGVPGTAGYLDEASIDVSGNMDSAAAGDRITIKLYRDGDGTGGTDDATGDAEFVGAAFEYTTS